MADARYDYDYVSDDTDAVYEIFEIRTGNVVDWANTVEEVLRRIAKLEENTRTSTEGGLS